ncbi:STAS domain-containing protein [Streptomyces sp. NPDC059695]|uniref:STAS domain-containing protein n=1 Tax=Streptomyces sp. NPDC059695 TaxID=3346910 RepID=UPI003696528D
MCPVGRSTALRAGPACTGKTTGPGGTALLQATGEFDTDSVTCLHQALADAIDEGATCLRVDLASIAFGDVALVDTLLRAQEGPARLVMVGPLSGYLRRLFELTGTTGLFTSKPEADVEPGFTTRAVRRGCTSRAEARSHPGR